jgi:hypothetical protein
LLLDDEIKYPYLETDYLSTQAAATSGSLVATIYGESVTLKNRTVGADVSVSGNIEIVYDTSVIWDQLDSGDTLFEKDKMVWEL